jgi:hypothetical protein
MALIPTYTIVNTAGIEAGTISLVTGLLDEAFRLWSNALAGSAALSVRVEFGATSVGRAQGNWGNSAQLGTFAGFTIVAGAPSYELMTGTNLGGSNFDIRIELDPNYVRNELYLDPTPTTRGDAPIGRVDGLSVMLHEIGHALGFNGYYNEATNTYAGNFKTTYDSRLTLINGEVFFDGPNVRALTGGPVPLTNNNYAHYGNSSAHPGSANDLLTGLMNGVTFHSGFAYAINELDLAILADTGLGTIRNDILNLPSAKVMRGGLGNDTLIGSALDNVLFGDEGEDVITGGAGLDTIHGGDGVDIAMYGIARSAATIKRNADGSITVTAGVDGTDTLSFVEKLQFSDQRVSVYTKFADPAAPLISNFAVGAGGWSSQDRYPRHVADINGDGFSDIVGFGEAGVFVSYGSASGTFSAPALVVNNFGQASGWTSNNRFHREVADLNGDGRADIIGFGIAGTWVSLAQANGNFSAPVLAVANFGANQGWVSQDGFTRAVGDVNGDGRADIAGFGYAGAWLSLGRGDGTFAAPTLAIGNFGVEQGWISDNQSHRAIGDINGDGFGDVVGFGHAGTWAALSNGDGTFGKLVLASENFGRVQGWSSQDAFARHVADVNGDDIADIVGFGVAGTWIGYGRANGTFSPASRDIDAFAAAQGWTSDNIYHRALADLNGDGLNDIVGFGQAGVFAGYNQTNWFV